ncbi:MAG: valine--tRNA ligase [Gammaproteobacteria bacterium]
MEKIYDPKSIERKWYNFWGRQNCFTVPEVAEAFCIMLPPPNVTGNLHMGHAFQHTIMDALIRFNRMQNKAALWQSGMDHAGISTQMVVEKQLAAQNIKRTDLSREEFVAKVWQWKEQSGGAIKQQMQRLGTLIDWSRERFTLEPHFCDTVKKVFVQLHKDGLIYKGKKLVNWDPILQTAISDLEVTAEEGPGNLWYIKYPLVNAELTLEQENYLTIATTRPETLLGDVAVCVNPTDPRYQHLIGKQVVLPIVNKKIPIIADDYADPAFGTGCVKITPAHDFNDYAIAMRHNLPLINIFTKAITLNENVPTEYQNLDKLTARKKVLEDLEAKNLLLKTENITSTIPKSSNTNAIVEPYLTDQWFIKMEELAKPAILAVESGQVKFVPNDWANVYFEWLNNIKDWCISRQLWWGHQIPAWYDQSGNVYVAEDEKAVRKNYKLADDVILTQDPDVLDTWFSAALWPFVTLGWPEQTIDLQKFFPTDVLVTGFDIIFFWVARMIMFSLKFTGKIPFHTVYIHGIIQDQDGQKMSKSKGNVIDPIDLVDGIGLQELLVKRTTGLMQPQLKNSIEQKTKQQFPNGISSYGTDALRFTFCNIATHNRHIKFELLRLEGCRNFCNKLWNAARFVLLNIENQSFKLTELLDIYKQLSVIDQWILSIWQQYKKNIIEHFNNYRFDLASKELYEFIWNEYCDWYLELAKTSIGQHTTKLTLVFVMDEFLRALHPMMPYITEEIWQTLKDYLIMANKLNINALVNNTYPKYEQEFIDYNAEQSMGLVKKFIIAIRNIRGTMNINPSVVLPIVFINNNLGDLLNHQNIIKRLAKINTIEISDKSKIKGAATAVINQTEIWVPLQGLIDNKAETNRLQKEISKLEKQLDVTTNKLNNPEYLNNAPAEIVAKEQQKRLELQATIDKLNASLQIILEI